MRGAANPRPIYTRGATPRSTGTGVPSRANGGRMTDTADNPQYFVQKSSGVVTTREIRFEKEAGRAQG